MKIKELKAWLTKEIESANQNARESHNVAMNSYGAGHDRGFADALMRVQIYLDGKLDS